MVILKPDNSVDYKATYEYTHRNRKSYMDSNQGQIYHGIWQNHVKLKSPILEVGCGNGKLCKQLAAMDFQVTGVDVADGGYDRQGYAFQILNIAQPDEWPFMDKQFAFGMAFDVFAHLQEREIDHVITEFMRVTRSQVLSIPNCRGGRGLHRIIKPLDWWLDKLVYLSDDRWKMVAEVDKNVSKSSAKNKKVGIYVRHE